MIAAHDESWGVLTTLLPAEWQMVAFTSGAVSRLRGFDNVASLLRTLLMHVGNGYSLRETATRAKAAGLASVSDVALLERLRTVGPWWRYLCASLLEENGVHVPTPPGGRVFRAVDGTVVKEPGKTGSSWRIHYTLRLPGLECDHFEITRARASGGGEKLERVPVRPGDCLLADRGLCHTAGVLATVRKGADVVVRLNPGNLPLQTAARQRRFDLLGAVQELEQAGQCGEWEVWVKEGKAATRLRWQIELVFKRLKSLAELGHLAKHDEQSARSWLYGKLLLGLLTQKLIRMGRDVSPWGYPLPTA